MHCKSLDWHRLQGFGNRSRESHRNYRYLLASFPANRISERDGHTLDCLHSVQVRTALELGQFDIATEAILSRGNHSHKVIQAASGIYDNTANATIDDNKIINSCWQRIVPYIV